MGIEKRVEELVEALRSAGVIECDAWGGPEPGTWDMAQRLEKLEDRLRKLEGKED